MPLQWLSQNTKSSTKAREFQRYQGMVALATDDITGFSEAGIIPVGAQMLLSSYAFFQVPMKSQERLMYGVQSLLTLLKLALMSTIYLEKNDCKVPQHGLCIALVCVNYLYKGLLALNWFIAELNKEEHPDATSSPHHHHHRRHARHHAKHVDTHHQTVPDADVKQITNNEKITQLEVDQDSEICHSV